MSKKNSDSLFEYLFVDINRLESYIAQIDNPMNYEKILTWNAKLSIKGPEVKITQQKVGRKWSDHEMITRLLDYLETKKQLDRERKGKVTFLSLFCLETCTARKVVLPSSITSNVPGIRGLVLWISPEPEENLWAKESAEEYYYQPGPLHLIECYFQGDPPYMEPFSGYSALIYLLRGLHDRHKLTMFLPNESPDLSELARSFARDPFSYFSKLKAYVGNPRRIKCLYRRRAAMIDMDIERVVTIAYPIFIADAT
jgi:hypothetical protein